MSVSFQAITRRWPFGPPRCSYLGVYLGCPMGFVQERRVGAKSSHRRDGRLNVQTRGLLLIWRAMEKNAAPPIQYGTGIVDAFTWMFKMVRR